MERMQTFFLWEKRLVRAFSFLDKQKARKRQDRLLAFWIISIGSIGPYRRDQLDERIIVIVFTICGHNREWPYSRSEIDLDILLAECAQRILHVIRIEGNDQRIATGGLISQGFFNIADFRRVSR
jgi:hypothetical protein